MRRTSCGRLSKPCARGDEALFDMRDSSTAWAIARCAFRPKNLASAAAALIVRQFAGGC